jgi:hypothetical protein
MAYFISRYLRGDDQATREAFGIEPRAVDATIADTVRWVSQTRHLPAALAGRLAP